MMINQLKNKLTNIGEKNSQMKAFGVLFGVLLKNCFLLSFILILRKSVPSLAIKIKQANSQLDWRSIF
jgi:hypothetical protein